MMKRIAQAVRRFIPTDAIAMLKKASLANGIKMEWISSHVILIHVSKFVAVRLLLNDVMHEIHAGRKQKIILKVTAGQISPGQMGPKFRTQCLSWYNAFCSRMYYSKQKHRRIGTSATLCVGSSYVFFRHILRIRKQK